LKRASTSVAGASWVGCDGCVGRAAVSVTCADSAVRAWNYYGPVPTVVAKAEGAGLTHSTIANGRAVEIA
jgi:hypothetical protein